MNQTSSTVLGKPSTHFLEKMLGEIEDFAIIFLGTDGVISSWNRGAETIKGYQDSEALGKNFEIFYTQEDRDRGLPQALLAHAVEHGKAIHEGWRVRKAGTLFWGTTVITALHGDDGKVIGFSKVTRDLTSRKLAEDALAEKNRKLERSNAELSSFAYIASHDLQEPLRKIQTFLSRIADLEKDKLSEKSVDFFNRIQNAGQRMQQLIEDLLAYSRTNLDETKLTNVDLNSVIADVGKDLSEAITEKKGSLQVDGKLPIIRAVPFQIHQLFVNLVNNSLKFSKSEQPPVITVRATDVTSDTEHRKMHRITVEDNGIGFEDEYKEKIFELFQRLHGRSEYKGTGIGLAICKKIAENHGGSISAVGVPDQGATFFVDFPAIPV